jgi:hypothetical protein
VEEAVDMAGGAERYRQAVYADKGYAAGIKKPLQRTVAAFPVKLRSRA